MKNEAKPERNAFKVNFRPLPLHNHMEPNWADPLGNSVVQVHWHIAFVETHPKFNAQTSSSRRRMKRTGSVIKKTSSTIAENNVFFLLFILSRSFSLWLYRFVLAIQSSCWHGQQLFHRRKNYGQMDSDRKVANSTEWEKKRNNIRMKYWTSAELHK